MSLRGRWEPWSPVSPARTPRTRDIYKRQTPGLTVQTEERDLLVPSVRHIRRPRPGRRTCKRGQSSVGGGGGTRSPPAAPRTQSGLPAGPAEKGRVGLVRGRSLTPTSRRRQPSSSSSEPRFPAWPLPPAEWPALILWSWPPRPCAGGPARASPAKARRAPAARVATWRVRRSAAMWRSRQGRPENLREMSPPLPQEPEVQEKSSKFRFVQ